VDIRLRGYAADIKAGAPYLTLFNDYHLQALLGRIFSNAVTTRARTDDEDVT
jgi:hypothetical protein